MARKVRDATMDSGEARRKLKVQGKPYYRQIERGLHLGYRRLKAKAGTWVARHYVGDQQYEVESLGTADDQSDADGTAILDYWQAQAKARERMTARTTTGEGKSRAPLTVSQAMTDYIEFLEHNRKSAADARYHDRAFIEPKLGELELSALTADDIRKWLNGLAKAAPRLRTAKGEKQQHREAGTDDEAKRRRRASANRILTTLKAGLNMAFREGKTDSDAEWRRVEPFEAVDAARIRYLTIAEAQRLVNACDGEFRPLVQAALQTGARYGELARLTVADFNPDAGTVAIRQSKGGKPRHVVLTDEGVALFKQCCAGRAGSDLVFSRNGGAWLKSQQGRPMVEAVKRAKIKPVIGFHGLRHTWASLAVMNGTPLLVVAKNLGHSDTRMVERHYGHLAPSYIVEAIRAGAPRFGFKPDAKVAAMGGR
jgi:integrase